MSDVVQCRDTAGEPLIILLSLAGTHTGVSAFLLAFLKGVEVMPLIFRYLHT